ncbi:MAG: hypothetical protein EBU81_10805, partial [Proteobacteria bacterium]|nr:hypothetical protein [Pseudomonadota bacterium]
MFQLLNPLPHGLALRFQCLALLLEDPRPLLRLGQGATQRLELLPVLRLGATTTHARSLSRKASCNGYTYTAFTGTF